MLPIKKGKHQSSYKAHDVQELPACKRGCCNGGTKLEEVTNHYLTWVEAHSMRWNPHNVAWAAKSPRLDRPGNLGETKHHCSLLKRGSNKMTPNGILTDWYPMPCSAIIRVDGSAADGNTFRDKTLEHSALQGMFPSNPSSQGSGNSLEEKGKECQSQRGQRNQGLLDLAGMAGVYELRDCTGPAQVCTRWRSKSWKRSGHSPPFLAQTLSLMDSRLQVES